jgi:hypothetical protein
MKKRHFLSIFRTAWRESFMEENIQHAFEKPGIWPLDPFIVLNQITRPIALPPSIEPSSSFFPKLKTPRTTKSIRHFQADFRKNPSKLKLEKLFKANEELAAQAALDKKTKEGLIDALKMEKKCRTRGKRLNVLGEEHNGPILFDTATILRARVVQAEKEEKEKQERARIDANKAEVALKKQRKEEQDADKRLQAVTRRENRAEIAVAERAEKRAQKKKETAQKTAQKVTVSKKKSPPKDKTILVKRKVVDLVDSGDMGEQVEAGAPKRSRSGRVIKKKAIFEE